MVRSPCCEKIGLKKGPWSHEEDQLLINYINLHGHSNWRVIPIKAGLLRCGKSCRLRWANYLRPDIKRGNFTSEEEETIIKLHDLVGNKWASIAAKLPGRTDNEIKNIWHSYLRKGPLMKSQTSKPTKFREHTKSKPKMEEFASDISSVASDNNTSSTNVNVESRDMVLQNVDHGIWSEILSSQSNYKTINDFPMVVDDWYHPSSSMMMESSKDFGASTEEEDFWCNLITGAEELPNISTCDSYKSCNLYKDTANSEFVIKN